MRSRLPRSLFFALVLATGCGGSLPAPKLAEHPSSAYQPVPFPAPPARPEFVPRIDDPQAVWIDGEWRWRGIRWGWIYGRWVRPPKGAAWAPSSWRRTRSGELYVAPGTWRDAKGRPLPHPRALRLAGADEGDVLEDEGLLEDVGPNERANKKRAPKAASNCTLDCPMATDGAP
jgi:hypothetical protein